MKIKKKINPSPLSTHSQLLLFPETAPIKVEEKISEYNIILDNFNTILQSNIFLKAYYVPEGFGPLSRIYPLCA